MPHKLNIGFVGLTHLGLCTLASTAKLGISTYGFDFDNKQINKINNNKLDIVEPNLNNILKKYKNYIKISNDENIISKCDLVFLSHDVSTNSKGDSNLMIIKKYIKLIKNKIKTNRALVILCQVPPGFTRKIKSNKFDIYYQVETLIFGNAISRAQKPERIIVGKKNISNKLNIFYEKYLNLFNAPKLYMNYESAELSKIAINLMLISSISTSNTLSQISKKINADWDDISKASKLDKRIGKFSYLRPSLGLSGGNLERNLNNIIKISNNLSVDGSIFKNFLKNSNNQKLWIYNQLKKIEKKFKINSITFLGITYKENTNSIKNSNAIYTIRKLKNIKIYVYDPVIKSSKFINKKVYFNKSIKEAIHNSKILIISTPWEEFYDIDIKLLKQSKLKYIIDPYRVLFHHKKNFKCEYYCLGTK